MDKEQRLIALMERLNTIGDPFSSVTLENITDAQIDALERFVADLESLNERLKAAI